MTAPRIVTITKSAFLGIAPLRRIRYSVWKSALTVRLAGQMRKGPERDTTSIIIIAAKTATNHSISIAMPIRSVHLSVGGYLTCGTFVFRCRHFGSIRNSASTSSINNRIGRKTSAALPLYVIQRERAFSKSLLLSDLRSLLRSGELARVTTLRAVKSIFAVPPSVAVAIKVTRRAFRSLGSIIPFSTNFSSSYSVRSVV